MKGHADKDGWENPQPWERSPALEKGPVPRGARSPCSSAVLCPLSVTVSPGVLARPDGNSRT